MRAQIHVDAIVRVDRVVHLTVQLSDPPVQQKYANLVAGRVRQSQSHDLQRAVRCSPYATGQVARWHQSQSQRTHNQL